jgi:hypothetical protein
MSAATGGSPTNVVVVVVVVVVVIFVSNRPVTGQSATRAAMVI